MSRVDLPTREKVGVGMSLFSMFLRFYAVVFVLTLVLFLATGVAEPLIGCLVSGFVQLSIVGLLESE